MIFFILKYQLFHFESSVRPFVLIQKDQKIKAFEKLAEICIHFAKQNKAVKFFHYLSSLIDGCVLFLTLHSFRFPGANFSKADPELIPWSISQANYSRIFICACPFSACRRSFSGGAKGQGQSPEWNLQLLTFNI